MPLDPDIEAAARVALAGLDVRAFLKSDDQLELAAMDAIAVRVLELRGEERGDLARRIRNEIAEMLDG